VFVGTLDAGGVVLPGGLLGAVHERVDARLDGRAR